MIYKFLIQKEPNYYDQLKKVSWRKIVRFNQMLEMILIKAILVNRL